MLRQIARRLFKLSPADDSMEWHGIKFDAASLAQAFPPSEDPDRTDAARVVARWLLDYRSRQFPVSVEGHAVHIPCRLHIARGCFESRSNATRFDMANCLMTRSTNGYDRQNALRAIIGVNASWSVPFVVALSGEYVIQILEDIEAALPKIDAGVMGRFLAENPDFLALTRARVTSYWNEYYRNTPRSEYVGFRLMDALQDMTAKT